MKISITLTVALLATLNCSVVCGQTDHVIDFLDIGNAKLEATFKREEKVRVRIDNVNRFLYTITVEKTEKEFNATPPEILSGIKLPSFLTTQLPGAGAAPTGKKVSLLGDATALQKDFDDKFKDLVLAFRVFDAAIDKHNEVVHMSKNCGRKFTEIETDAVKAFADLIGGDGTESIPVVADKLQTLLSDKIEASNSIVNDMSDLLRVWKTKALKDHRDEQIVKDDKLADLNRELADLRAVKAPDKNKIHAKEKEIRDLERLIKQFDEDFQNVTNINESTLEKAKTLLADINKYKEDGKYLQLVDDLRKVNPSNYTFYSETVEMKKDQYTFAITVAASERLVCNAPGEHKIEVTLRTKGGVKIDFSTGLFVMGGSEDFLGRSYYYKPVPGDSTSSTITTADNGKRLLLGVGALTHIYRRSPAQFKVGLAAGISTTFSFDAANFHAGPSFIVGDNNRLCVSVGPTLREVSLLDTRYELDTPIKKTDLPEAVPTYKMFPQVGWFLSVTYNLSQLKGSD